MRALRGGRLGTPDLAEQAGVLPNCQRQHDRKESCSKHVMLATRGGKSRASQKKAETSGNPDLFKVLATAGQAGLRNLPGRCRIPRCDRRPTL
jgi:hypothetical protein